MKKHKWYNEIIAFAEGKEIEVRGNYEGAPWFPASTPQFCDPKYEFRVKTKPKYIPFTFEDRDVFRGKWVRHKGTKAEFMITNVLKNEVNYYHYEGAFNDWEFLDGTPFGKLEGGSI